jgi:hypothetical protein
MITGQIGDDFERLCIDMKSQGVSVFQKPFGIDEIRDAVLRLTGVGKN